jgi:hypothetical protein
MYGKVITAGGLLGTAIAIAATAFSEPAKSEAGNCLAAWPNYPISCLTTAEGRVVSKPVRLAAANPFPADMPRALVIGSDPLGPEIEGVPLDPRFDDRNYFPDETGPQLATLNAASDSATEINLQ